MLMSLWTRSWLRWRPLTRSPLGTSDAGGVDVVVAAAVGAVVGGGGGCEVVAVAAGDGVLLGAN